MNFKDKVKKFLALSSTVLLTTLSEGVKAEEYSLDKPLTQIAFAGEMSKEALKSIRDIIEERLDGAKNWIQNSKELERLFGDNIPSFPLELMVKKDKDKETRYFLYKNKEGEKGFIVYTEGNGYFIPFGKTDIKDLEGNPVKPYMSDMVLLGQISLSAKEFREKYETSENLAYKLNSIGRKFSFTDKSKALKEFEDIEEYIEGEQKDIGETTKKYRMDSFLFLNRDKLDTGIVDKVAGYDFSRRELIAKTVNIKYEDFADIPEKIETKDLEKYSKMIVDRLNEKTGLDVPVEFLKKKSGLFSLFNKKIEGVEDFDAVYSADYTKGKEKIIISVDKDVVLSKDSLLAVLLHEYGHALYQKELVFKGILNTLLDEYKKENNKDTNSKLIVNTYVGKNAERLADSFGISVLGNNKFSEGIDSFIDFLFKDKKEREEHEAKEKIYEDFYEYPSTEERIDVKIRLRM